MKLLLLKLTASALVATPGVYALNEPQVQALRGGYVENADFLVEVKASCEDGLKDGKKQVDRMWKDSGENCDNVWQLEDEADDMKDRKYRGGDDSKDSKSKSGKSNKSSSKKSYDDCARQGVNDAVKKIEKRCLEDDSSQCMELGKAAAEHVVMDNFCTPGSNPGATSNPDYKKECKKAATSICEGQIPTVANKWCHTKSMSTSKMRDMQGKCKKQVNKMVDGDEFVFVEE